MVYSNYNLAVNTAHDMVHREECDLYLCRVKYPSGEEFVLRKSIPLGFTCVDCFRLPFHHHFKTSRSAVRAAKVFESRMGIDVKIDPVTFIENGYKITSHFQLCLT